MEVTVSEELDGARLDKALVALVPGLSRARVKRAIDEKAVRVNGKRSPKGGLVAKGDVLAIDDSYLGGEDSPAAPEPRAKLAVVFESNDVVVVDKPAGQPTAPLRANEAGTLANALVGHFPEIAGVGHSAREPGLLHRLDTDTSGLVIVARSARAFDVLHGALKDGQIHKTYLLVCKEEGLADEGTIAYPIAKHPKDQRRVYPCIHPRDVMRYEPRPAETTYRVLERKAPWALVEVTVARALRHQIRAHFAAIEHPLAGDVLYGGPEVPGLGRHALHASRVSFEGADGASAFDVRSALPFEIAALTQA